MFKININNPHYIDNGLHGLWHISDHSIRDDQQHEIAGAVTLAGCKSATSAIKWPLVTC
jgi:hypothetical protein